MLENLEKLREKALTEIRETKTQDELEVLRVRLLGRKSELTRILRNLRDLSESQRRLQGSAANNLKKDLEEALEERRRYLDRMFSKQVLDLTLPGRRSFRGHKHPLTVVTDRIVEIFVGLGFEEVLGPEVETEWYNFEALNIPEGHPARGEMFGNFYLPEGWLLRSHTSPVQIRVMEKMHPPVRIIAPGRVYRRDAFDASHSPVFHQVEGLYVDEGVSFADLKGNLEIFSREMFGEDIKVKFSPSYFPFTEPSAELSISCVICSGEGCRMCSNSGWLEILGCGMVHPQVLRNVGYDPDKVTGFAFGMGVERVAIIRYRIDDIRNFYNNDLRFLDQFYRL